MVNVVRRPINAVASLFDRSLNPARVRKLDDQGTVTRRFVGRPEGITLTVNGCNVA